MSRHRVGVRQDDYEDDDYYSQSPGSYPGDSLSSSVERQYMFNRLDMLCKNICLNEYLFGRLSVDVGVGEGRGGWWGCVCEFVLLRGENYFIPIEESEPLLNHLSPTMAEMLEAVVETWRPTLEDSKVLPAWQAFPLMKWNLNLTSRYVST